jgi:hypothetical protein
MGDKYTQQTLTGRIAEETPRCARAPASNQWCGLGSERMWNPLGKVSQFGEMVRVLDLMTPFLLLVTASGFFSGLCSFSLQCLGTSCSLSASQWHRKWQSLPEVVKSPMGSALPSLIPVGRERKGTGTSSWDFGMWTSYEYAMLFLSFS